MFAYRTTTLTTTCLLAATVAYAQNQQSGANQAPQTQPEAQTQRSGTDVQSNRIVDRLNGYQPPVQIRGSQPLRMTLATSAGRIASDPAQFYGSDVNIQGEVSRQYNPHVFTVKDDQWWTFGDDLVVLVPRPEASSSTVAENTDVIVSGTVRRFVRAEFERDYDWFDSMPDLEIDFSQRPVLVADMAQTADGRDLMKPTAQVTRVLVASADQIARTPSRFYGHNVAITAEVEAARSAQVLSLDEDAWFAGPDVMVFNPHPVQGLNVQGLDDKDVTVYGVVRPYSSTEFDQDYDWFDTSTYGGADMNRFERRPIVVASSIKSEDGRELVMFQPGLRLDTAASEVSKRMQGWENQRPGKGSSSNTSSSAEKGTAGKGTSTSGGGQR
jgi:hypothetical protein